MPSPFDALWAAAQPAFDGFMGEAITVEPLPAGDGRRIIAALPDPANAPFLARGIFRDATAVNRAPTPRSTQSEAPDVLAGKTTADFAVAQFTAATMPREGWMLVLASRLGAPRYAIGAVKPDGVARLWCVLTFKGNSA